MRNADGQKTHLPHYEHISCTFLQRMHKNDYFEYPTCEITAIFILVTLQVMILGYYNCTSYRL
jgi:hypothetical protein